MPRFFEEVKEILETIPFGGDSMIWSTFLITTLTLTVTLADLSLPHNEKTPASARVLTIVYGGKREPHPEAVDSELASCQTSKHSSEHC